MGSRHDVASSSSLEDAIRNAPDKDAALGLVLAEAERAMSRLKLSQDAQSKKTASSQVQSLLDRAERIKTTETWRASSRISIYGVEISPDTPKPRDLREPVSTRPLSKAEQIIILKASYVNGSKFPPWQGPPDAAEFANNDGVLFHDPTSFGLSSAQQASLDGWKRPHEALPPPTWQSHGRSRPQPTMLPSEAIDFVQDAATDCSVVASMCAGVARAQKGHSRLMGKILFPYDMASQLPKLSDNGKYVAKLNFNGAFRRVEIDDRIPVSKSQRVIHVLDRNNPSLIWPPLVEKMYLKVRGGYDFPGSNSATDLWILSGWVPEQVFLENEDTSPSDIWRRIWNAHQYGDVMVTLGTGKMSAKTEREVGLASEHDYAVLDLREEQGQKLMLVKNPWCEGSTWAGSRPRRPSTSTQLDEDAVPSSRDLLNANSQLSPGTFWMDLNSVTQHFESIYLNWNPGLFKYRQDIHFTWDTSSVHSPGTFVANPQFSFSVKAGGVAWLLLCRHFGSERQDSHSSAFINLSLYDAGGSRIILKEHSLDRVPLVDSYQNLLRLDDLKSNHTYTIVPDQDGLPRAKNTFTLSALANTPIQIAHATDDFASSTSITGSWNEDTAGGNTSSPIFSQNPQYSLTVSHPTPVSILLDTTDKTLPVNVKLCFSNGKRIQTVRTRDILGDSKQYRPCCALAKVPKLDPGTYTIICSTFEAGQLGKFHLRVDSNSPVQIRPLPSEGAGRLRTIIEQASFSLEEQACAILLLPQRLTKFVALAKQQPPAGTRSASQKSERSLIRVSVVQGTAFQHVTLACSSDGEYSDSLGGVRTDEIDLSPAMNRDADIWLVIERNFTAKSLEEEAFSVEFFTESRGAVQTGDWRRWEE
ncbi:calpain family cysteine protease [Elsinoe australis]|uniref:Calpain family cysteine protease n=1 Tax=Elsinoe australis TaxID=40998 RepID=A0A4U7B185_9PEZI|nr:calpain family cysteine protease [Elsinoe australis]